MKEGIGPKGGKIKDMTGLRCGRLTVKCIDEERSNGAGQGTYWFCKCDCGKLTSTRGAHLRRGATKSCGCLIDERNKERFLAKRRAKRERQQGAHV